MALTLKAPGQAFALARASIVTPSSPGRWLVGLRWAALLGMFVTTLVAVRVVPAFVAGPVLVVLAVLTALNVFWTVVVFQWSSSPDNTVTTQISLDVMALTAVLWFSGGLSNPFACFLTFQIVLAGLLGRPGTMVHITVLTLGCAVLLPFAPALSLDGAWFGTSTRVLGELVALTALSAFTGFFVFIYQQRLEAFREQVARNDKLAALGRTLGAMSHELNTPLGTLLLAGKELALVGGEISNVEVQRLGTTVVSEATRASDVIALLRGYVRPDARRELMDVCAFVPAYVEDELNRLRFRGERVVRVGPPAEASVIRAALCQILTNVMRNAVEAMEHSALKRLTVDVAVREDWVDVTLQDTGPGVEEALLPTLGEPFATTKADAGGTGLGLYVSSLLAERMGATVALESRPGQGTRVTLSIPTRSRT